MSRDIIFLLKACISVLKPFYKVTISIVMHSCYYLRWNLSQQQDDPIANSLQEKLLKSFEFYMEKYEVFNNSFLCCATYLNPEYRDLIVCSDKEKEKIRKEAKNYTLEYFKTVNPTTNEPNETTASDDSADSFTMRNASKEDSSSSRIIDKEFSSLVKTEFNLYSKTISKLKVDKFWCALENNQLK